MTDWKTQQMIKASGWPMAPEALYPDADFHTALAGGLVPLHWACREGKAGVLRYMLDHGARVADTPGGGHALLALAVESGSYQTVMLLIDQLKSARSPLPDEALTAALHHTFRNSHTDARNRLQQTLKDWARKARQGRGPRT